MTSLILLPFFLPLVCFLAGSTTCTNPEEPDHVRLLPWAWRVRHQWPFPAGIDTSSPVYVATFKSAISDVGCSGTNLTRPLVRKTQPYKDSLEEIAHSHDKHFACEAENGTWMINFNMHATSCFPYMHWSVNMQSDWQVESAYKFCFWLDEPHLHNVR